MLITEVSHKKLVKGFWFYTTSFWKYFDLCYELKCVCVCAKSLQSCPSLCDPMDYNMPSSSVHGIVQGRILEWVAMPSSRGASQPRDGTRVSYMFCIGRQVLHHQCHHPATKFLGESPKWWHLEIWSLGGI